MKSHLGIDCHPLVMVFLSFLPSPWSNKSCCHLLGLRSGGYLGNRLQTYVFIDKILQSQSAEKNKTPKYSYGTAVCRIDSNWVVSFLISKVVFATTCGDKSGLSFGASRASMLGVNRTMNSKYL